MRLKRLEALRFGGLSEARLEGLGEGLTVVFGPNESGKTTFTTLVRHVLYGFPNARAKERSYAPASGEPHARLVFEDATGEWAIERAGKVKGGAVRVETLRGEERPLLLDELVAGVTEQTFRIVYGFGLDDLPSVGPDGPDGTIARFYAAEAGTAVSPVDAEEVLHRAAGAEYGSSASKPVVNRLSARAKELRASLKDLERQMDMVADDQREAIRLEGEVSDLRERRGELDVAMRRATDDLKDLRAAFHEEAESTETIARLRAAQETLERDAPEAPDERVLAARAETEALLAGLSGWEQRVEAIERRRREARAHIQAAEELGPLPEGVTEGPGVRAEIVRRSQVLAEARAAAAHAQEQARIAEARARGFHGEAGTTRGASKAKAANLTWGVLLMVGLAGAIVGVVSGQWIATAVGAMVAVVAVASWIARRSQASSDELGAEARRLWAEARSAAEVAVAMEAHLAQETASWGDWLAAQGLDAFGVEQAAVFDLLDRVARRSVEHRQERVAVEEAAAEEALAAEWETKLRAAARAVLGDDEGTPAVIAVRLRQSLEGAVTAAAQRVEHERSVAELRGKIDEEGARLAVVRQRVADIAARNHLEVDGIESTLQALHADISTEFDGVNETYESAVARLNQLVGSLGTEGRESAMNRTRQELEGVEAQIAEHAERYTVYRIAQQLMARTREVFERERQPEIIPHAAECFRTITEGRYAGIKVPLGEQNLFALTADGAIKSVDQLSRGTADELYLSARMGLIASMRTSGVNLPVIMDDIVVNFDAARRAGAAQAVALLAQQRQVIFFTCHEDTAATLVAASPSAVRIDLARV